MHSTTFCGNKRAYSSGQTQQHDCETKRIHKSIAWVPRQLECRMFRTFLPSNWYQQKTQAHQEGLTTQHGFLPWPKQRHCARTNGAIEQKKLRTPLPPPKKPDFGEIRESSTETFARCKGFVGCSMLIRQGAQLMYICVGELSRIGLAQSRE